MALAPGSDRALLAAPRVTDGTCRCQIADFIVVSDIIEMIDVHVDPRHLDATDVAIERAFTMGVIEHLAMFVDVGMSLGSQWMIRCIDQPVTLGMHQYWCCTYLVEGAVAAEAHIMHFTILGSMGPWFIRTARCNAPRIGYGLSPSGQRITIAP